MKDKKYFCYEIYKNLAVWSKNGKLTYTPCSFFIGDMDVSETVDISKAWNGKGRAKLIQHVENDIPIAGCSPCYKAEAAGLISRRMSSKKLYEEYHTDVNIELDSPQGLDYSVGNLCNLKCVICSPSDSSAWIPDYQKINPLVSIEEFKYQKFNQLEITNLEFLHNIKSLHIHGGGEPLMSNSHINLLKSIKSIKGLGDLRVFYNTNGTVRASQELLDLWSECKLIELYFSIDDIGERFNYQRTGADWETVVNNIIWYQEQMPHNHMFNINCTWGYLNLFYLSDLVEWHKLNFNANRYGDPVNLIFQRTIGTYDIKHVSKNLKQQLQSKFKNYPQLVDLVNSIDISDQDHSKFWNNINKLDQVRQTSYKTLCPEWSQLL